MASLSTPTVVDWVGAFGDALSGIGTAVALIFTARLLHHEQAAARSREREDRQRQASLVAAWSISFERDGNDAGWARVRYRNGSNLPVFGCTILVRPYLGEFPPASHVGVGSAAGSFLSVLEPGQENDIRVHADVLPDLLVPPPAEIMFTDCGGHHWRRKTDGQLEELQENIGGVC